MRASKSWLSLMVAAAMAMGLFSQAPALAGAEEDPSLEGYALVAGGEAGDARMGEEPEPTLAEGNEGVDLGDAPLPGNDDLTAQGEGGKDALVAQASSGVAATHTEQ